MTAPQTWSHRQQELAGSHDQLMRRPWTEAVSGLCERQLRTLEGRGLFPRRTKIAPGGTAVGWSKLEVLQWVSDRLAERDLLVAEEQEAEAIEAEADDESDDEPEEDDEEI